MIEKLKNKDLKLIGEKLNKESLKQMRGGLMACLVTCDDTGACMTTCS